MFPANHPAIRPAAVHDTAALQALARADGGAPLGGRILVAELGGRIVAAISRGDRRGISDAAGGAPPGGRIRGAGRGGGIAGAIPRDARGVISDAAVAPPYAGARLWSELGALEAYEWEPDLATRAREAVLGTTPEPEVELPI